MNELRDFRDAIDSIEVTDRQKRQMYSNIIRKAESRRRSSLPSLALKLAPVLSLCLILVLSVTILPSLSSKKADDLPTGGQADYLNGNEFNADAVRKTGENSDGVADYQINGIACTLMIRDITSKPTSADSSAVSIQANETMSICWQQDGREYILSSNEVTDEQQLWQLRDLLISELENNK